jgi:MFS-type transporter involved in bile tolerance (Atg22 family)
MGLKGMTAEKVAVVWGLFVSVSGLGMFVSPIVVGVIRDYWGTFTPGFLIWGIGAWSLLVVGLVLPESVNGYSEHGRLKK